MSKNSSFVFPNEDGNGEFLLVLRILNLERKFLWPYFYCDVGIESAHFSIYLIIRVHANKFKGRALVSKWACLELILQENSTTTDELEVSVKVTVKLPLFSESKEKWEC